MIDVLPTPPQIERPPWRRLAVVGDSIAEGVREPHPGYRDLSWVDWIAESLDAEVLNLGERHLVASEVRERQLEAALAFEPDLAVVAAGGNDALRRGFSPESVGRELDGIVRPLRRAGADVVMLELLDIAAAGLVPRAAAEPLRQLAATTREVASRNGALLVEMRDHPAAADASIYASDRLHLNTRGHAIVGVETLRVLATAVAARRRGELTIDVSMDEVLEDLCWPGPAPGGWDVSPASRSAA
jgi:lysophospholipase L1-like esterase